MIKTLKSNKFISILLVIMCIFLIIKPNVCASSCLNAISVWSLNVLPMLFPFFIFTRLLVNLIEVKPNFMDKFFNKSYNAPNGSFFVFFLSILSGYPMGAKIISSMYNNNQINKNQASTMLSFCSVSGPMFIIGTVGVSILNNKKIGVIILISNIIACLINGFIYKNKEIKKDSTYIPKNKITLADIIYDSLISILMVGAYIVLSFIVIAVFQELKIFNYVANIFNLFFGLDKNTVEAVLIGVIEITNGCLKISNCNLNTTALTIITSTIIAFGGISVFMQSLGFIKELNISKKTILKQKLSQAIICLIVTFLICIIFY